MQKGNKEWRLCACWSWGVRKSGACISGSGRGGQVLGSRRSMRGWKR